MKPLALALALLLVATPRASADSVVHFNHDVVITWDAPTGVYATGPGYYLTDPLWDKLDKEVRRLQTAEVRLTAENASLARSNEGRPLRLALWIVGSALVGFAGGVVYMVSR